MSQIWLGAAGAVAGVATGWGAAYFRYRVQLEAARLRSEQLETAINNVAKALAEYAAATREEIQIINAHLWELHGNDRRKHPRN